ncbi:antibiotic biosynthesis monooxygenase [Alicyclobacillus fastidiosus]|uniref:Antibiotic biosynthesis monooxygenase n=1 Tax=Alicyclobacillus fastidiosus TaxID=392011 RepID=A0ABY6ZCG3_9BACL|nr:antibiotic biosynthesis monooxygenase [Alicyclobacillus fastidiosus]WAH40583.1 antibiotic biosynthesis monooxygenase [Alicyclobacillus fastidiosus]GMA62019.1 hypothetical protein GCM10025859_24590 [Alicyclobacillus fastidiosus]
MSRITHSISSTPKPPYYAVILTVIPSEDDAGYHEMAENMIQLAKTEEGFLGVESAESDLGIIVSYWNSFAAINRWSQNAFHQSAKSSGKSIWYKMFRTRICKVEQEY